MTAEDAGGDDARLKAAFPRSIRTDVVAALAVMPTSSRAKPEGSRLSSKSIGSNRLHYQCTVGGEAVEIPDRIYHDDPGSHHVAMTPVQRTILGCLYTRHHDGFVRQQWLRTIVHAPQPWVAPFVIRLLGEYVPEIIDDICHDLPDPDDPRTAQYERFVVENPQFLTLTRQRADSYWNAYFRAEYPRHSDYPGYAVLDSLEATISAR